MQNVKNPFISGYSTAYSKDQNGDQQVPKIQFLAVTKWMLRIGGASAPPQAHQHQDLVTSIDAGMNAFRPHRRASGSYSDDELNNSDRDIGKQRPVDCLRRVLFHYF